MNRISDEILTMHGFKGVGNSDILKMHGFNKDETPLFETVISNMTWMPEYIHKFSDGTYILVNYDSRMMWLSWYQKMIQVPFSYTNSFKFYEENGEKYVITYDKGSINFTYNNDPPDTIYDGITPFQFTKYKMYYDSTNPTFTQYKIETVTTVPERVQVAGSVQIADSLGNIFGRSPYRFEYDPEKNMVAFFSITPHPSGQNQDILHEVWVVDLNTKQFTDYQLIQKGYGKRGILETKNLITTAFYKGNILAHSYTQGSVPTSNFKQYTLTSQGLLQNSSVSQNTYTVGNGEGYATYFVDEENDIISFNVWRQQRSGNWELRLGNSEVNMGILPSFSLPPRGFKFPNKEIPTAITSTLGTANIVNHIKANMKYWTTFHESVTNICGWSCTPTDNPYTIVVHSIDDIVNYEMNVEIENEQLPNLTRYTYIRFKDAEGNIIPHYIEPKQPNNTKVFVLRCNLKKGWNTFTYEQGTTNTSNPNEVFDVFYDLRLGKPDGWIVPQESSNVRYRFDRTRGLIGGRISGSQNAWIDTGKQPEFNKRYEICFNDICDNNTAGQYQFGQMTQLAYDNNDDPDPTCDGVRSDVSGPYSMSYRRATISIRDGKVIAGSRSVVSYDYLKADTIVGFEFGKNRSQVYSYALNGSSIVSTSYRSGSGSGSYMNPYRTIMIVPGERQYGGVQRQPNMTNTIKYWENASYDRARNELTSNGVLYYRERKPWLGETVTIGCKNTYLIKTSTKTYLNVPM